MYSLLTNTNPWSFTKGEEGIVVPVLGVLIIETLRIEFVGFGEYVGVMVDAVGGNGDSHSFVDDQVSARDVVSLGAHSS
jgi:hypothetical protein